MTQNTTDWSFPILQAPLDKPSDLGEFDESLKKEFFWLTKENQPDTKVSVEAS